MFVLLFTDCCFCRKTLSMTVLKVIVQLFCLDNATIVDFVYNFNFFHSLIWWLENPSLRWPKPGLSPPVYSKNCTNLLYLKQLTFLSRTASYNSHELILYTHSLACIIEFYFQFLYYLFSFGDIFLLYFVIPFPKPQNSLSQ